MTQYITIKDAADLSGKSIQTIRRMIKSKKVKYRKDRTPQGFNYLIDLDSLQTVCNLSPTLIAQYHAAVKSDQSNAEPVSSSQTEQDYSAPSVSKVSAVDLDLRTNSAEKAEAPAQEQESAILVPQEQNRSHQQIVSYEPVKEFNDTMQKLIEQHGKEKENLFRLVETFQNKVISLENKLKVESNSKKGWFKIW